MEYIYLLEGEDCWDWGAVGRLSLDDGKIQQKVQESIWNHEAYKWRTSRELYYEHYALVVSLIGRLTWGTDEVDVRRLKSSRREVKRRKKRVEEEERESSSEEDEEESSSEEEEERVVSEEESSSEEEEESSSEEKKKE